MQHLKNEQHIIYPISVLYETQAQMTNISLNLEQESKSKSKSSGHAGIIGVAIRCQFVNCQMVKLSNCQIVKLPNCEIVKLLNC